MFDPAGRVAAAAAAPAAITTAAVQPCAGSAAAAAAAAAACAPVPAASSPTTAARHVRHSLIPRPASGCCQCVQDCAAGLVCPMWQTLCLHLLPHSGHQISVSGVSICGLWSCDGRQGYHSLACTNRACSCTNIVKALACCVSHWFADTCRALQQPLRQPRERLWAAQPGRRRPSYSAAQRVGRLRSSAAFCTCSAPARGCRPAGAGSLWRPVQPWLIGPEEQQLAREAAWRRLQGVAGCGGEGQAVEALRQAAGASNAAAG